MELTWIMKFRIVIAMAIGAFLIGIIAFPLIAPEDPIMPIVLFGGNVSLLAVLVCIPLAFVAAFVSYYLCAPFGKEIAILAAPAGLAILSLRGGTMTALIQMNSTLKLAWE